MSQLKYCQGPDCHTYYTQDRLKGIKGSKTYQTRRRSNLLFNEFCNGITCVALAYGTGQRFHII